MKDTWNISHIYKSVKDWKADFAVYKQLTADIIAMEGKWHKSLDSVKQLYAVMKKKSNIGAKLSCYCQLQLDTNMENTAIKKLAGLLDSFSTDTSHKLKFITQDMITLGKDTMLSFVDQIPELEPSRFNIINFFKSQEHILSKAEEELLAKLDGTSESDIFSLLQDLEIPRETITLESGESVVVDYMQFQKLRESNDTHTRRNAVHAFWRSQGAFKQTFSELMNGFVKSVVSYSRIRKYPSYLEQELSAENIDVSVYKNLITSAKKHKSTIHKFINLRKQTLGLGDMRYSDLYAGVSKSEETYTFDDSAKLLIDATKIFGREYTENLIIGLKPDSWIDKYPAKAKNSGAYCNGALADVHPYVLLNHLDTYDSASTLAHEMGHAMHSFFSNKYQPRETASYSTFIAEIASILNELLFAKHIIDDKKTDESERLAVMDSVLERLRTTFYRQTLFAEFELSMYEHVESGNILTDEWLCNKYHSLLTEYYGDVVVIDELAKYEWSVIPHMYYGFYVWNYATSFMAATWIFNKLQTDPSFATIVLDKMLSAGGSKYPLDILKDIGLDMSSDKPITEALKYYDKYIAELSKKLKQKG